MDFARVLSAAAAFLTAAGQRFVVIGGVALAAYGRTRTTFDLDLLVLATVRDALIEHLESLGYRTLHRSSGYSNHAHSDPRMGRLDIVYVDEETAEKVFALAQQLPGPHGLSMPTAAPEHLVAMKVLAMKNDPARVELEMADLRFLLNLPQTDLEEARRGFERRGLLHYFEEIRREA
jgi:Nucleotidyl transferase of unknown function (DUF2204)